MAADVQRRTARATPNDLTHPPSNQDPTGTPRGHQPARPATPPCTPRASSPNHLDITLNNDYPVDPGLAN